MALILVGSGGCSLGKGLTFKQPEAPPGERELKLEGDANSYASAAGRREFLLAFPAPGSVGATEDLLFYLTTPEADGRYAIGAGAEGARGFLIQTVGLRRGRTDFDSGELRVSTPVIGSQKRKLTVDILCIDGSRLEGTVGVVPQDRVVAAFRRRYAIDVATLNVRRSSRAEQAAADEGVGADSASVGEIESGDELPSPEADGPLAPPPDTPE